jgi:hypothetical protein
VREAKACPACGQLLRSEDPADPSFSALRHVAVELLMWAALVLSLAFLWAPPEDGEALAFLAFAALCAWLWQRPRQRAEAAALLQRRRYRCAHCKRDFQAGELD